MIFPSSPTEPKGLANLKEISRALKRLINWRFCLLVLFGLVLLEGGLRLGWPHLAGQIYARGITGGHPVLYDQNGYRVGALPAENTNASLSILALGDSTTFGTGVAAQATWPLQLDRSLGSDIAVHNAGMQGAGLHDLVALLDRQLASDTPPDTVLLLVTANMISFTDFRWANELRVLPKDTLTLPQPTIIQTLRKVAQSSALLKVLTTQVDSFKYGIGLLNHRVRFNRRPQSPLMAYGWVQPDIPEGLHSRMWIRFEDRFKHLNEQASENDVCLIVGYLPPRFMVSDSFLDNQKFVQKTRLPEDSEARLLDIVKAHDVPFIDVGRALRTARQGRNAFFHPFYTVGDYSHLNAQGHGIVAKAFLDDAPQLDASNSNCL